MSEWDDVNEITLFSLCLWGEARGENIEAQVAMANVIWNRHTRWGKPLREVILSPKQFSSFNANDPNLAKIRALRDTKNLKDKHYWQCYWVAWGVMYGYLKDNTHGALYYHTTGVDPKWDDDMIITAEFGITKFYREA